ncbi:MAG: sulfatase [Bryobacterales bacterium]|nr:sulfatase [Bryobacterales bacterium]
MRVAALMLLAMALGAAEQRPNVVLILADDLGWSQIGANGGQAYRTPHIDRLASEGMRFTSAYSSAAVCSPTRAALMSGLYPARLHLTDHIKGSNPKGKPLLQPEWHKRLDLEVTTIAEVFRRNGYRTAHFGKWHLSQDKRPPASLPYNPDKQGFDDVLVTYKPIIGESDPEVDPHNVQSITDNALRFLESHGSEPFFLYLPHNSIHEPVIESRTRISPYIGNPLLKRLKIMPTIAAIVERLDDGVGQVLSKLDQLGLRDNTMVIFYSDNGGKETFARQDPLRSGKGWLYEGGVRVPLMIRWPGHTDPGSTTDHLMTTVDFFPTFLELLDDEDAPDDLDGESFLDVLRGQASRTERTLYWHYPHYHVGSGMVPAGAVRRGKYKLIEWFEGTVAGSGREYELFDLAEDISESRDLTGSRPEIAERLKADLEAWRGRVGAQMPIPNPKQQQDPVH